MPDREPTRRPPREAETEPRATPDDLEWDDAYVFGSPTRFGNVAAQLKQFIDSAGQKPHGDQESTLLALEELDGARHLGEGVGSIAARLGAPVGR